MDRVRDSRHLGSGGASPTRRAASGFGSPRYFLRQAPIPGNPDLMSRERPSDRTGGARKPSEVHVHRPWPLPSQPWVMAHRGRDRLFAHWPVDPEHLRPLIPGGLTLECHTGRHGSRSRPFAWRACVLSNRDPPRAVAAPTRQREDSPEHDLHRRRDRVAGHADGVRAAARCRGLGAAAARGRRRRAPERVPPCRRCRRRASTLRRHAWPPAEARSHRGVRR